MLFGDQGVNSSYHGPLVEDIRQALIYQSDQTNTISCPFFIKGQTANVSLYQWFVSTYDMQGHIMTYHTVCRYSELSNSAPSCPWNACRNFDCSDCTHDWATSIRRDRSTKRTILYGWGIVWSALCPFIKFDSYINAFSLGCYDRRKLRPDYQTSLILAL